MEQLDTFEVRQARKDLEEAIAKAALVEQLEKVRTVEEMGALGWRVLTSIHYEDSWQHCAWVWVKDNDHYVTHVALTNDPPGHCGFIKLLTIEELKALIVEEASG